MLGDVEAALTLGYREVYCCYQYIDPAPVEESSMKPVVTILLISLCGLVNAADHDEPALGYTLRIGDKQVRIEPGQEIVAMGNFQDPKIALVPDKFRQFTYAGMAFKYPANFAFEADFETEGVKIWSLDGNDFVIMLHQFQEPSMTPQALAEEMVNTYGPESKSEPISYRFNGAEYKGTRVHFTVFGTKLFQDILGIPTPEGSRLLLLQDLPAEEKVSEEERKLVLKLLDESLKPDSKSS